MIDYVENHDSGDECTRGLSGCQICGKDVIKPFMIVLRYAPPRPFSSADPEPWGRKVNAEEDDLLFTCRSTSCINEGHKISAQMHKTDMTKWYESKRADQNRQLLEMSA